MSMEKKVSYRAAIKNSETYPLSGKSIWALRMMILVPLLGCFFLGTAAQQSYRSIVPVLFESTGFMAEYVTATLIGTLTGNVLSPLVGKLGDLFGRRIVLIVTGFLPVIGALMMGVGKSIILLTAGYSLCAMASTFRTPLINGLVADLFDREQRPKLISNQQSINLLCTMFAPLMGSMAAEALGVQAWYLVSAGFFLVAWILSVAGIPKVPQTGRSERRVKIDWIGTILMQIPVITLCLAVGMGGQYFSWSSATAIILYIVTIAGFIIFAKYERSPKVVEPFLDMGMFKNRNYALCLITSMAGATLAGITMRFLTLYLLEGVHFSTTQVSFGYLIGWVGVVASPLVGSYVSKTGRYRLMLIISAVLNVSVAAVMYIFYVRLGICNVAIYMIQQGLDSLMAAFMVGPLSAIITNCISKDKVGIALSMRVFSVTIVTSIIGAVYNAVYNAAGRDIIKSFGTMVIIAMVIGIFRVVIALFFDDSEIAGKKEEA